MKKWLAIIADEELYKIRRLQLISYVSLALVGIEALCILWMWVSR